MRAAVPDYHPACRPLPTAPPAPSSLHPTTTAPPSPPLYTHTAPPASVCSPRWAPPPIFPHRIFCGVFPLDPFRGFLTQMGWQGAHATKHPCSCQMSRGRDPQCNYHQSINAGVSTAPGLPPAFFFIFTASPSPTITFSSHPVVNGDCPGQVTRIFNAGGGQVPPGLCVPTPSLPFLDLFQGF